MRLARWLHERGITSIAACTRADWQAYAAWRTGEGMSRDRARKILGQLTGLWAFDQLTGRPAGSPGRPGTARASTSYLPAAGGAGGGENATEPLDPQAIGPLLVWAIRITEDFADDILAAWAENRRLTALAETVSGSSAGMAALEAYLLPLIRSGSPLPPTEHKGTVMLARTYIAATTGASPGQVDRFGTARPARAGRPAAGAVPAQHPGHRP